MKLPALPSLAQASPDLSAALTYRTLITACNIYGSILTPSVGVASIPLLWGDGRERSPNGLRHSSSIASMPMRCCGFVENTSACQPSGCGQAALPSALAEPTGRFSTIAIRIQPEL